MNCTVYVFLTAIYGKVLTWTNIFMADKRNKIAGKKMLHNFCVFRILCSGYIIRYSTV